MQTNLDTFVYRMRAVEGKSSAGNRWGRRHAAACAQATLHPMSPRPGNAARPFEIAIVAMGEALALYADAHQAQYDHPIGSDGVLGEHWRDALLGLLGLLNGETGRLDCGTLDGALRDMAAANGAGPA